jgi:hypothetical protein
MPTTPFTLRRATSNDADAIAEVFSASFRLLSFLPELHTLAEDRSFIANIILKDCEVIVAADNSGIVSFLALQGEEVRLLYTRPDRIGEGAGTQLIEAVKKSGVGAFELWCFQANARARRSTRREASMRSASPTERGTRRKHPTSATSGKLAQTVDGRPRLPRGLAGVLRAGCDGFARLRRVPAPASLLKRTRQARSPRPQTVHRSHSRYS